ncbi:MAG: UDP-glucose 4-epimerase GalE [Kiritimatiellia bacterium]
MHILVTGGAGYIGTHTVIELLSAGYEVTIVDNLYNSQEEAVRRGAELAGRQPHFYKVDLLDAPALEEVFKKAKYDAVIHFAGLKAVGESISKPLFYYDNNMTGTFNLLRLMKQYGCRNIVFSSSATVYGMPKKMPLDEGCPTGALNPYGATKLFLERVLTDVKAAEPDLGVILLRYFNPVGAHISGRIGENPNGIPNNLMPYIAQVAVGRLPKVRVMGNDYATKDGTGVRDYIHVVDLAQGHLSALKKLEQTPGKIYTVNLGTGHGYSVLEMIKAFSKACGKEIPYEIVPRRPGDAPECYADPSYAKTLLGWSATHTLDDMCADSWRWQSQNPNGYDA